MTYNVCFSRHQHFKRMEAISQIIEQYSPDIVCLQEVRQDSLRYFLQSPWTANYSLSNATIDAKRHYGEVIFSKYPILKTERFPFRRTHMSRHVNIADLSIPVNSDDMLLGHRFTVVTAHLESKEQNRNIRREQMMGIFDMMIREENVFFMGDTNFMTDEEFSPAELPPFWMDVWHELVETKTIDPTVTEYTFDAEKNKNADGNYQSRLDRVFCKSVEWVPTHFELVGTDPIPGTKLVYPSDHFGVYVEFVYGGENDNEDKDNDEENISFDIENID